MKKSLTILFSIAIWICPVAQLIKVEIDIDGNVFEYDSLDIDSGGYYQLLDTLYMSSSSLISAKIIHANHYLDLVAYTTTEVVVSPNDVSCSYSSSNIVESYNQGEYEITTPSLFGDQNFFCGGSNEIYFQLYLNETYPGNSKDFYFKCYNTSMVGLEDDEKRLKVDLFPNPASSFFVVQAEEIIESIRILTLSGHVILNQNGVLKDSKIGLQGINQGVYLVEVRSKRGVTIQKLIIE